MASINLQPGVLPPPACYASEQERFEAYVAKIVAIILGGIQWEFGASVPIDLALYWLRKNSDTRPRGPRVYSAADGRWVPWLEIPIMPDSSGGSANAYTVTTGHNLTGSAVQITGRRIIFTVAAANTGASTLAVDGGTAVAIVRHSGVALQSGDLVGDCIYEAVYNAAAGGRWEIVNNLPPPSDVTATYESTEASVPSAGTVVTIPHGGTVKPGNVDVRLECLEANRGYEAGDEVDVGSCFWAGLNTGIPAFTVAVTDTHVLVIRSSSATSVFVAPKDAGAAYNLAMDLTKWKLKVYCVFHP